MSVEIRTSIQPYITRNIRASEGADAGHKVDAKLRCEGRQELSNEQRAPNCPARYSRNQTGRKI